MGLDIDNTFNSDSYLNISTIRTSIDNVHTVLSLYDDFDHNIKILNVSKCSKILLECYKTLTETFGLGFSETQFKSRYTSIPMNTYSVFTSLYTEDDYLSQCLSQYFGESPNKNLYLEYVIHSQRNFVEIYENVIKENNSDDEVYLVDKLLEEYYKKLEILVKVLFYLSFQSFQLVGKYGADFNITIPNDLSEQVKLVDLVTCYGHLNLLSYFMDLLESYCRHYLEFEFPAAVCEVANKYASQFNINLHLKLFSKDTGFSETLNKELESALQVVHSRFVFVQSYLKSVQSMYTSVDFSNAHFGKVEFDSDYYREFISRIIWNFYDEFCHAVSPFLSIVEAIELVERLRHRFERSGLYSNFDYLDAYLTIAYKTWEDELLSYIRALCLEQYHSPIFTKASKTETNTSLDCQQDFFTKEVNHETAVEAFNTVFGQFMALTLDSADNNHYLSSCDSNRMFGAAEDFLFLKKDESCVVSNNLYSIMAVLLRLLLMPVFLNYELMHLIPDHLSFDSDSSSASDAGCVTGDSGSPDFPHPSDSGSCSTSVNKVFVDKSRIIMRYIARNSNLIQSSLLLYIFSSNSSFKNFLYSISRFESLGHSVQDVVKVFLVYLSDVHYINHLVTMVPYLAQYAYYVYYRNYTATAITCSYRELNELVRRSYKVSFLKVSLCKLQDYLTVHLSAFNQQYVQKLVASSFSIMYHTSTECFGDDLEAYLSSFNQLFETCLTPKVFKSVYNICVDLIYNGVVYESLEFFESISYKFNRQFVSKVSGYVDKLSKLMEKSTVGYDKGDFVYEKKFNSFAKLFSYEFSDVEGDLYFPTEFSKLNKLVRHLKML